MPKLESSARIKETRAKLRSMGFDLLPDEDKVLADMGVYHWVHQKSGKTLEDNYVHAERKPGQSTAEFVCERHLAAARKIIKES